MPQQSWLDYLKLGVAHMEGYAPASQRNYFAAQSIFVECANYSRGQTEYSEEIPIDVEVEAHFRLAQLYHYQRKLDDARR